MPSPTPIVAKCWTCCVRKARCRAGEIVAYFPQISQPAVSKHLRVLRQAKLVRSTKTGREQWYYLDPDPLQPVALWLEEYETLWNERLDRLKHVAEHTAPQTEGRK